MPLFPQGSCPAQAASRDTFPGPFPSLLSATVLRGSTGHPNQALRGMCPALLGVSPMGGRSRSNNLEPGDGWFRPAKGLQMDSVQTTYTLSCVLLVTPGSVQPNFWVLGVSVPPASDPKHAVASAVSWFIPGALLWLEHAKWMV